MSVLKEISVRLTILALRGFASGRATSQWPALAFHSTCNAPYDKRA